MNLVAAEAPDALITCTPAEFLDDLKPGPVRDRILGAAGKKKDIDAAMRALGKRFRRMSIDTPLLRDWQAVPRNKDFDTSKADALLEGHMFDGYGVYDVPPTGLDWHTAPLTCLTRFPFFSTLQWALHHTGNPTYLRFMVRQLHDYMAAYPMKEFLPHGEGGFGWIDDNTICRPWHWCMYCNRIQRLGEFLEQARQYVDISDAELAALLLRLYQETAYMRREMHVWVERRHNGGCAMIRAMIVACAVLDDFQAAQRWRRYNGEMLDQYIRDSFYPDGCCVELTCAYSASVADSVQGMVWAMGENAGLEKRLDTVRAIQRWLVAMSTPGGRIPAFGDLRPRQWNFYLHKPLARRLGQDRLADFADGKVPDPGLPLTWPAPGKEAWCGYYTMRSGWDAGARYLAVDGGPWGTTHSHGDKLSFVLSAFGADFIVDPSGTQYRNNEPDAFISTQAPGFLHSTITVDGVDEFVNSPRESLTPLRNTWRTGPNWVLFCGTYDFAPLKAVHWERRILFVDGRYWWLQDVLTGDPGMEVSVEQNLQMAKGVTVAVEGRQVSCRAKNQARLVIRPLSGELSPKVTEGDRKPHTTYWPSGKARTKDWHPHTENTSHGRGWVGFGGNKLLPAPAVTWVGRVRLPAVLTMVLWPDTADGKGTPPDIARVSGAGSAVAWKLPSEHGTLMMSASPTACKVGDGR